MRLIKKFFEAQFIRFALFGILNTLIGYAIMFCAYNFFLWTYWPATALNYLIGGALSYFLNKRFTFKNREKGLWQILRFAVNIIICYLIAYALARPFVSELVEHFEKIPETAAILGLSIDVRDNIAMIAGAVIYTILNFFGQKFFAFNKPRENKEDDDV